MAASFEVDFSTLPLNLRYKLLAALVAPRPIALVTTVGKDGVVNAAPFSFFNVFSEDPALVVLGLQSRPDGTPKDTLKHIRETDVFVVNLGSVVHLHARAGIIDAERLRVNLDAYKPIARLFGNLYARLGEKIRAQAPILYRMGRREWRRRGGRSRRDEALSTRCKGRRLKFAAHEMK
jgi:flavin reductase (DIM6/NTAB) family NADH-FMN oxidoreductase RutF